jgi:tetratricopeptide (TPR) repeat protein
MGQSVQEMFDEAVHQLQAGGLLKAGELLRKILTVEPQHVESLQLLGLFAFQLGRFDRAVELLGQAIRLREGNPAAHFHLGNALKALDRIDEAVAHFERALILQPDYAEARNNLGVALVAQGRLDEAVAHYERALTLQPDYAFAHNNLGIVLVAQDRIDDAVAHYERALILLPDYAEAHNNLGIAFEAQDRYDEAVEQYQRALTLKPDFAYTHNNLGNIFKAQGKFADALAHYGRAIAIQPDYAEAHFNRVEIKSFSRGDADLEALEALAGRQDFPPSKALYFHFALAKALEDTGDHLRAFEHLLQANALKRRQVDYDETEVLKLFQRIATVFDRSIFDRFQGEGDPSSVPVFVLGMPRSGSTLIEQILASHPQIHGAGELAALEMAAGSVFNASDLPLPYPECIPALPSDALRRLGQSYLTRLPALAEGKARVVDKMPYNFLRIGLIRLILPNARIIHTLRRPIDTCVSCFSKLFTVGPYFGYDLAELGRYYRAYSHLMTHWRSVLPAGAMLEVSYEAVVDDLEGQARRLIDYCGLPWDARCISFHKTSRPVKTSSAAQVRKPLYRTSLDRWRQYETGLAPCLQELGDIIPGAAPGQASGTTPAQGYEHPSAEDPRA